MAENYPVTESVDCDGRDGRRAGFLCIAITVLPQPPAVALAAEASRETPAHALFAVAIDPAEAGSDRGGGTRTPPPDAH